MKRIRDLPFEKPIFSSVLDLDGIDDYVNVGNNVSLQFSDAFTISALIRPTSFSGFVKSIIGKHSASGSSGEGFFLYIDNGISKFYFFQGNGASKTCQNAAELKENEIYHIVGQYDGINIVLYLNGVRGTPQPVTGFLPANSNNCHVGRYSYSDKGYFKGKIFNVKIWNSALTSDQIYSLFLGESITSNLVLHHNYINGNAQDLSLNGNNGTIIGAKFIRQLSGSEIIRPR